MADWQLASKVAALENAVRSLQQKLSPSVGLGLHVETQHGVAYSKTPQPGFPARLTSSYSPTTGYTAQRRSLRTTGTPGLVSPTTPETFTPCFEVRGVTTLAPGTDVWVEPSPDASGYLFRQDGPLSPPPPVSPPPPPGVTPPPDLYERTPPQSWSLPSATMAVRNFGSGNDGYVRLPPSGPTAYWVTATLHVALSSYPPASPATGTRSAGVAFGFLNLPTTSVPPPTVGAVMLDGQGGAAITDNHLITTNNFSTGDALGWNGSMSCGFVYRGAQASDRYVAVYYYGEATNGAATAYLLQLVALPITDHPFGL